MSDSEYVSIEHSDQEDCDHVCTHENDSDNMTASDYSDTDTETEEGYEEKMDKLGINYLLLWVTAGNVGKTGLIAYSENNSSLAKTLKIFITNDIWMKYVIILMLRAVPEFQICGNVSV